MKIHEKGEDGFPKNKKVVAESIKIVDFSSKSKPQGYFNKEFENTETGEIVKIWAFQRVGPFYSAKYKNRGRTFTRETGQFKTFKAASALGLQTPECDGAGRRMKPPYLWIDKIL
jgi:hypothetical protein